MATTWRPRSVVGHPVTHPSPLRHASTASSNGSSGPLSRSSTVSSRGSSSQPYMIPDRTRYSLEPSKIMEDEEPIYTSASDTYQSMRRALKPTVSSGSMSNSSAPMPVHSSSRHQRSQSLEPYSTATSEQSTYSQSKPRPMSIALSRSDSLRVGTDGPGRLNHSHFNPHLEKPELQEFQRSSTSHLRALSRFAQDGDSDDFTIKSKEQEVTGLHGRRRLQRGNSVRGKTAVSGWEGRTWMDQQRQYLQAYEYLCHIGEAKEWMEDIIQKPIPAIVKLEEALRDGIILAEVVQSLFPERRLRIFRGPGLTFRHSENIAIFFRLLEEVELPDLFWFELVDLYEKKNIPKVIYCIHSLSWILWRKGITDFRIGNLVGQLQFEDHELEAAQKGLDRAGISLPNFSGMGASFGAEPEPEPVETEEERIDRELSEHSHMIIDLQAQMRGALLRIRLGNMMQDLWDNERRVVELQSRVRGDFFREIFRYRLDMKNFAINLQSAARGFIARSRARNAEWYWSHQEPQVIKLQSLIRGFVSRDQVQSIKKVNQRNDHGIRELQAVIRGALLRRDVAEEYDATREMEPEAQKLQAAVRGFLVRQQQENHWRQVKMEEQSIQAVQSFARGLIQRKALESNRALVERHANTIARLQAVARAHLKRKEHSSVKIELQANNTDWKNLQTIIRGSITRRSLQTLRVELLEHEQSVKSLQNFALGFLLRHRVSTTRKALAAQKSSIITLQSAARGSIERTRVFDLLCQLNEHESGIIALQALARAVTYRTGLDQFLTDLEETEDSILEFQTLARGCLVRIQFAEKMRHYKQNMEKVIKIQSFVRARQQGEAYKVLTSGKNPPVGTVKNFVHLLNDSDFDFDEEIEFERLRKTIGQNIRENEHLEQYVDQLDIKIALLVKNKITLDEIIRHQKHFGGYVGDLLSNKGIASKDPFDLKALNKNSRKKLEHYQDLFFLLQTQPQYLARLLKRLRTRGLPEQESKKMELLTMGIFGFAQKGREEYYLLKLISRSTKEDLDSCQNWVDYLRGNMFWTRLFSSYLRSPRDRKYLKDLLAPLVKQDIIENEKLDLESDPMQIYLSDIKNEELQTGRRSRRPTDISREEAIKDRQTRQIFIRHLQDLRDIADDFFIALEETVEKMPYGIRYLAKETHRLLCEKFRQEAPEELFNNVALWTFKTYIQPALLQPDTWGVVDHGMNPLQKRNLSEVAKVVGQVISGRLFGGENLYLQPINSYIQENVGRVQEIWGKLINVPEPEQHFDIDEFNDLSSRTKPTLYMKLADIFTIHQMIVQDINSVCPTQDDILREVIRELGSAKNNENDMQHVSSTEITLTLTPKFHDVEDPNAHVNALFMETKRCVLYIIRIQTGKNLMDIMIRPVTVEDEQRWAQLAHDELKQQRDSPEKRANPYADGSSLLDIASMSYTELKRAALGNIIELERYGRITRANHYQDLLNAIALDIRTKHRRRQERSREIKNALATMAALGQKQEWLQGQLGNYNDYIEQAMATLQKKSKQKKRTLLPFSPQWHHQRELARSGRMPAFGSYKYSARVLHEKGVLVDWRGYSRAVWDKINLTISSDEAGMFHVEGSDGSLMIPGASASVPLDELLEMQFNNVQFVCLFGGNDSVLETNDGPLRLNVNLLVHLVMKKFYSQA